MMLTVFFLPAASGRISLRVARDFAKGRYWGGGLTPPLGWPIKNKNIKNADLTAGRGQ